MAASRDKRVNAGAKMAELLSKEADEADDFYKSTYGGFTEEADDIDFDAAEERAEDSFDSDFYDSSESEVELVSDTEGDEPKTKKRRGPSIPKRKTSSSGSTEKKKQPSKPKEQSQTTTVQPSIDRQSLRHSTNREEYLRRREEAREKQMQLLAKKKGVAMVRRLTQEELLAEAKITEQENIRSLELYKQMELEKKSRRSAAKSKQTVPMIRYLSTTMPLIGGEGDRLVTIGRCSRTFISFSDTQTYQKTFRSAFTKATKKPSRMTSARSMVCPITKKPAKYYDPVTGTPYANAYAFKVLRKVYEQELNSRR